MFCLLTYFGTAMVSLQFRRKFGETAEMLDFFAPKSNRAYFAGGLGFSRA